MSGAKLLGFLFVAAALWLTAPKATAAPSHTVERHAICWSPTKRVTYWHWAIWTTGPRDTNFPCSRRWAKGYAVITPFGIAGFHKHRTFGNLPDPNEG